MRLKDILAELRAVEKNTDRVLTFAQTERWIRAAYVAAVDDYEAEWYSLERAEGERPYGFEIVGITQYLKERARKKDGRR